MIQKTSDVEPDNFIRFSRPQQPADNMRTLWFEPERDALVVIDQTVLPHRLQLHTIDSLAATCHAIVSMQVRGAPLIGIVAAFGVYFSLRNDSDSLDQACAQLLATRPTAVNLQWALQRVRGTLGDTAPAMQVPAALALAQQLLSEDAAACGQIGDHGLDILEQLYQRKCQQEGERAVLNILTHCNAGWLATGAWGTALAPIYKAHLAGMPVHVWVDETRPRNQGASLTAWELARSGVPHTLIADNAGGHLMQHGMVDICLVGSDRTTANGDVCNKIGTYLKALAAFDNQVPFYAALPVSTIDFSLEDGVRQIPIEQRDASELTHLLGRDVNGKMHRVQITPDDTVVSNYGFDVTPARLVTGLITERGIFPASVEGLSAIQAQLQDHAVVA